MLRLVLVLFWLSGLVLAQTVEIAQGMLQGVQNDAVYSFKGIPYAAAPLADLRWAAPQAASSWQGVRVATSSAPTACNCPIPG